MTDAHASYSILLVNYKTRYLTSVCLELIRQHLDLSQTPVVVVDNASEDDSLTYLKSLNWIRVLDRTPEDTTEPPYLAHARALDHGLKTIDTDYVLVIHTDTLIRSPKIIQYLMSSLELSPLTAAVGTVDQRNRNALRRFWRQFRKTTRYYTDYCTQYYKTKISRTFSGGVTEIKPIRDGYLKSFCCLWDVRLIRKHGLKFCMSNRNPGYGMQDKLEALGYVIARLPSNRLFSYLDHVQSGTVVETGQAKLKRRRETAYNKLLGKECNGISALKS